MPLSAADIIIGRPTAIGLRWARQESGAFDWDLSSAARQSLDPMRFAPSAVGAGTACLASPRLDLTRRHITQNFGASAPMACPQKTGAPQQRSRLQLEWIANGFTDVCFWTVLRHMIVALESLSRLSIYSTAPTDSIESK